MNVMEIIGNQTVQLQTLAEQGQRQQNQIAQLTKERDELKKERDKLRSDLDQLAAPATLAEEARLAALLVMLEARPGAALNAVVDDHPGMWNVVSRWKERAGLVVEHAHGGEA